jgi:hypothetical protein
MSEISLVGSRPGAVVGEFSATFAASQHDVCEAGHTKGKIWRQPRAAQAADLDLEEGRDGATGRSTMVVG